MNPVSLTIFSNIYDNKAHRRMSFDSFDALEDLLYKLAKEPGHKPKKGESTKDSSPLITPAIFKEGSTRKNCNVLEWSGWACLDVDDFKTSFEDAINTFKGFRFVCYSTASSTKEQPRFRIVLPLTTSVSSDKIQHFWFALNTKFNTLSDKQTKDAARMFYIPNQYTGANNFIFSNKDGAVLNPFELMSQYPYSEGIRQSKFSDAIQTKMAAYKKEKLTNTNFKWDSYRTCPFCNKALINEYRNISETGWYSMMFKIMTSIASSAIKRGYPIASHEIAALCSELDSETGNWYKSRPLELEAERAIEWVMKSA